MASVAKAVSVESLEETNKKKKSGSCATFKCPSGMFMKFFKQNGKDTCKCDMCLPGSCYKCNNGRTMEVVPNCKSHYDRDLEQVDLDTITDSTEDHVDATLDELAADDADAARAEPTEEDVETLDETNKKKKCPKKCPKGQWVNKWFGRDGKDHCICAQCPQGHWTHNHIAAGGYTCYRCENGVTYEAIINPNQKTPSCHS